MGSQLNAKQLLTDAFDGLLIHALVAWRAPFSCPITSGGLLHTALPRPSLHSSTCSTFLLVGRTMQDTGGLGGRVDPQRIILWGSSYSGGHSLVTASLHGCDAAPGSTLPTAAATHAENTTAGHGSDAAQGNEAQHNASQRAPLLGTANSSSGIVAVVVMEPFVSAPLLVKRALFLNACPVGRASEEGVTARAARARRGQHGSPPNAAAAAAGWVARAAAVVCSAADQVMWGVGEMLRGVRILLVACSDVVRGWTGQPAAYLPLVLPESRVAGLQHKDAPPRSCVRSLLGRLTAPISMGVMPDEDFGLFMSSRPEHMLGGWQNMVAARMVFGYATYHPMGQLPGGTRCPVHMVAGLQDTLTPLHTIKHAAQQLGPIASVTALNGTHITLYEAPGLIPDMLQFLHAAVPLTPAPYT